MHALENIFLSIKLIHRQTRLRGMIGVRPVIAAAIAPPLQLAIVEIGISSIKHWLTLRQCRMTVALMKKRLLQPVLAPRPANTSHRQALGSRERARVPDRC